jgi:hypothetical protein
MHMRVRPKRNSTSSRRLPGPSRRAHARPGQNGAAAVPQISAEPAIPGADEDHPEERRARESGGPLDVAHYTCGCGYVFEAAVSTTVSCPHCGAGQAW